MQKDESGVWTVTTAPQDPGFHYYSLVIDGVSVADPASESYYGTGKMSSAIEIPEAGVDFYTVKDVPHGESGRSRTSPRSPTPGGGSSSTRLRVTTRTRSRSIPCSTSSTAAARTKPAGPSQGRTDVILDNLIAAGKARRCWW